MRPHEQTNAVVSLTLIGLALYFVLEFPQQSVAVTLFGTPLGIDSLRRWIMASLLVVIVMAGTDMVIRSHPALLKYRLSYQATFWMLPGLLVLLATQVLWLAPSPVVWGVGLFGVGMLLWLTIMAEFHQVSANSGLGQRWAYLWQQLMGYGLALGLFIVIYQPRSRGALSATEVLIISGMLALALLRQPAEMISRTWLYAGIIGLSIGQIMWAVNYWQTSALGAGLFLLLVFYVLVGLAQQHLTDKLSQRTLWEYGLVSVIALVIIFNV